MAEHVHQPPGKCSDGMCRVQGAMDLNRGRLAIHLHHQSQLKKPIRYEANGQKEPKDCYDYYKSGKKKSGVFKIKPYGKSSMMEVFCDMKNGGWTVIQKRQDGTTKFLKKWQDFKQGFGGIHGEHWLGNDHIHYLTNQDHYTLMIELTDWNKTKKIAEYDYFMIDDETEGYRLHIGGYHGDAGDGMAKHNNHKFSTPDVDNDKVTKEFGGSCAKRFSGAWWYYKCYMSNLNGIYYRNGKVPPKLFDGVAWKPWTGSSYSLRSAEMKIRPSTLT
ncbi:angiopoietin-related protein 1-like [Argopecten irradians]|uniref:angiopoietin-related protein 1-like n=1 Tax=Argopecten irradians TaxID=31199 RepID=UPI003715143C